MYTHAAVHPKHQLSPIGAPQMANEITDDELQQLLSEGLTQNEIAKHTGIPRTTLRRRFQEIGVPKGKKGIPLGVSIGTLNAYKSTPPPPAITEAWDELTEMLSWWRARKNVLQPEADTEQETERKTYHVQKRYIEAIQRAADLEHVSITEIVNRAFKQFFDDRE
jgi:AraC-like DNA-binding protein